MIQQFINRVEELRFLEEHYKSRHSELIIIYGRRRIGKTELIAQFIKDKPAIYLLATYKPLHEIIKELQLKMAKLLKNRLFEKLEINNFEDLFLEFIEFLKKSKITEKVVICIDEFPILIQRDKGIVSIFQKIWDEHLRKENIMLILLGSSISMMETDVLGYKSPLYGRRTGQWLVEEFKITSLMDYFWKYSKIDIIRTYGVIGGVPGYITKFDPDLSLLGNIREKIFRKGEFLYDEPEILMREKLRDPTNYFSILRAIASGSNTFGKIVDSTGLDKSLVSKYLSMLQSLRIVERDIPIFSSLKAQIKVKRGQYKINDNFFRFWFNYVYPFKSEIEANNIDYVTAQLNETFNTYMGFIFEDLVRKPYIARALVPFYYTDLGRWWYKDKEIDLVAANSRERKIFFMEVKWSKLSLREAKTILKELKEKAKHVDWNIDKRKEYYGVIAIEIEDKNELESEETVAYSVDDLFRILSIFP
ncbi:MAG: ATP-binding protein [Candidatus Asgardarchaeum sp.]